MDSVARYSPLRPLIGNPALEALELRDFGAPDCTPTQDGDAFPPDEMTDREIDALYVAEMERRDREASAPAGYVAAACLGCGAALFVPESGRSGDVLCPGCQGGDDDTPPPAGSPAAIFAQSVKSYSDDLLVTAIGMADAGELFPHNPGSRQMWLVAAAAELVKRLDKLAKAA